VTRLALSRGFLIVCCSACATASTSPGSSRDLLLSPIAPNQIDLSWRAEAIHPAWEADSASVPRIRIERRDGQDGVFQEITTIEGGVISYEDRSLSPGEEYCYRVGPMDDSGARLVGCSATPELALVDCTADPTDNRGSLVGILRNPSFADWTAEVGLTDADPDNLLLVEDDAICRRLWSKSSGTDPDGYYVVAFFRLGDRYIVTKYLNPDRVSVGYGFTTVLDEDFNLAGPTLAW
jgi:hypothetical protein